MPDAARGAQHERNLELAQRDADFALALAQEAINFVDFGGRLGVRQYDTPESRRNGGLDIRVGNLPVDVNEHFGAAPPGALGALRQQCAGKNSAMAVWQLQRYCVSVIPPAIRDSVLVGYGHDENRSTDESARC